LGGNRALHRKKKQAVGWWGGLREQKEKGEAKSGKREEKKAVWRFLEKADRDEVREKNVKIKQQKVNDSSHQHTFHS